MYDKETNSLWSHILGECKAGELKGTQLRQIPSVITDWENWQKGYPKTTVLMMDRTARRFKRQFYRDLESFVLGISNGEDSAFWSFQKLNEQPVMHDQWLKSPVVLMYDRASATPRLYDSRLRDKTLSFRRDKSKPPNIRDTQTGSIWNPVTGIAISGPLKGQNLAPLPAIVSLRRAWLDFHPESEQR